MRIDGRLDWRAPRNRPFAEFIEAARRARPPIWRTVLGAAFLYVALVIASGAVAEALFSISLGPRPVERRFLLGLHTVAALIIVALCWLPLPLLMLAERRGLSTLLARGRSALGRRFGRHLLVGAAMTAAATPALIGFDALLNPEPGRYEFAGAFAGWGGLALATALLAPLQASAEEAVFRGYLLQNLAARLRSPLAWAVAPSLAFGWLHYDPSFAPDLAAAFVASTAIFGLGACYLTWRTGSLGVAIGAHVMNNWIALLLLGLAEDDIAALALWQVHGAGAAELTLSTALEMAMFALAVEIPAVRRFLGLPRWSERPGRGAAQTSISQ